MVRNYVYCREGDCKVCVDRTIISKEEEATTNPNDHEIFQLLHPCAKHRGGKTMWFMVAWKEQEAP